MTTEQGIVVVVKDGTLVYEEGRTFTVDRASDLVVFGGAGAEVARFEWGNWLSAYDRSRV